MPIFAPITIGIALYNSTVPDATRATNMEVTVELLCKMAVANNPINKPMNGLEVTSRMPMAVSLPMYLSEVTIKSMLNKKKATANNVTVILLEYLIALFLFNRVCF